MIRRRRTRSVIGVQSKKAEKKTIGENVPPGKNPEVISKNMEDIATHIQQTSERVNQVWSDVMSAFHHVQVRQGLIKQGPSEPGDSTDSSTADLPQPENASPAVEGMDVALDIKKMVEQEQTMTEEKLSVISQRTQAVYHSLMGKQEQLNAIWANAEAIHQSNATPSTKPTTDDQTKE